MSDEQERADFYQSHKDEAEVWVDDEAPAPEKKKSGLGATVTLRLPQEDAELLRRAAKEMGVPYSEVLRRAVAHFLRPTYTVQGGIASQLDFLLSSPREPSKVKVVEVKQTVTHETSVTGRPLKRSA
jgi:predicted DNA binding CopG/RHH family protein